ncbi:hypothetical protein RJ640_027246 [Escallonia rubra]|uniref:Photolyase/cryptochrome alpha/beta domain-containing protein n=1 Tax=Escallonia rubra TaxID=112253 RepID=A0AA88UF36_9ASTE|nr:hypothetical protein RJ640_027246 [Escallonia rubra]
MATAVQQGRIRVLKEAAPRPSDQNPVGPVVYWMFRDQRLRDNWALIHAVDEANKANVPVAGEAIDTIPNFLRECGASMLVTDFSPLREVLSWKEEICKRVSGSVSVHEVDAHNVVPAWVASQKLEYSARTLRGKINKLLPEYLVDFPTLGPPTRRWLTENQIIDWENLITEVVRKGAEVPEINWCEPGEHAALEALMGTKNGFLTTRLKNYSSDRNNPLKPKGLSGLSPYLHFGQIAAQRCALEARRVHKLSPQVKIDLVLAVRLHSEQTLDAFLEELIVRRELADNYCLYQPQYGSLQGAWEWARKSLMDHASDKRELIYTKEQLEKAQTADPLWNASQLEMVHYGKMHGFMRQYEIDGRDPNGYVGCMWSICGVHDQGWQERPVFGKIRYMNYAGCKRKFNVDGYIAYVKRLVVDIKKRKGETLLNDKVKEIRGSALQNSR